MAGVGGGFENLEIAQGGGVEQQGFVRAVFAKFAEVFRFGAEGFGGVIDQRAGCTEGGVVFGDAEAVEVEHAEGLHDRLGSGGAVEVVIGNAGDCAPVTEVLVKRVETLVAMGQSPLLRKVFRNEDLAWIDTFEGGEKVFWFLFGCDEELARSEVEPSGVEAFLLHRQSEEKVVALGVYLRVG